MLLLFLEIAPLGADTSHLESTMLASGDGEGDNGPDEIGNGSKSQPPRAADCPTFLLTTPRHGDRSLDKSGCDCGELKGEAVGMDD